MTGKEFVTRLLGVPRYRQEFDENEYFRNQVNHIQKVDDIHTHVLLDGMVSLAKALADKDLEMIEMGEYGKEYFK